MVDEAVSDSRESSLSTRDRVLVLVACTAAALPTLASGWRAGWGWMPVGDAAVIALRATDVWSANTPLVGMPTTLSDTVGLPVHHPGPMEFWLISLFQAVLGHPAAPMVAMVAVNVGCAVVVVWCGRWLAGARGAGVVAAWVALSSWSVRGDVLIEPYNPYAAHLPLAAFLASTVASAAGHRWALPLAVVTGSYAAQAHVSLLAPVVAVVAVAVVAAVIGAGGIRRSMTAARSHLARPGAPVAVALGSAVILWSTVIIDLVAGNRNLWRLATSGGPEGATLGLWRAWNVVARALVSPHWLAEDRRAFEVVDPVGRPGQVLAVVVVAVAVAAAIRAWPRRRGVGLALVSSLAALGAGVVAVAQIPTGIFNLFALPNYLWLWPVTGLFWLSLAAAAAGEVVDRWEITAVVPPAGRSAAVAVSVAVVVGSVGALASPVRTSTAAEHVAPTAALTEALRDQLDPDLTYLVEFDPFIERAAVAMALIVELERHGFDLVVPPDEAGMYGEHRVASPGQEIAGTLVVLQDPVLPDPPAPDADLVAVFRPDPDDVARWRSVGDELAETIRVEGGLVVGLELEHLDDRDTREAIDSQALLGWWDFGLIASPTLDPDLMARYRSAANAPIVEVGAYLVPVDGAG